MIAFIFPAYRMRKPGVVVQRERREHLGELTWMIRSPQAVPSIAQMDSVPDGSVANLPFPVITFNLPVAESG
jgi:hypothetical protein